MAIARFYLFFYNSHENKLFYLLTMWCIFQIVKEKLLYSRDAALLCVCHNAL